MKPSGARRFDNNEVRRGRPLVVWSQEEDELLREQVRVYGIERWARVAEGLPGKTSRQCRRRWNMFLNVVSKRGGWTDEEDNLLLENHDRFGNRWTEIAKNLPGRTDNAVKNRYSVLCKKQTRDTERPLVGRYGDHGTDVHSGSIGGARTSEPSEETLKLWRNLERRVWLLNLNQQEPTSSLSDMNERLRDSFESDLQTCKDSLQCAQEAHNTCMTVEGSQVGPLYYYPEPLIEGGTQPSEGYLSAVYDVNSHSELLEGSLSGHPRAAAENSFLEQRIATDFSSIHQDRPSAENLEQVLAMYEEPSACDDSSSHNRRPLVESLQQSKRLKVVDASNELMGCQKPSTVSNVPWNLPNEEELPRSYFSQERAMSDLLTWWEERDITAMMSRAAYQGRDILRDFEEFKQTLVAENKENSEGSGIPPKVHYIISDEQWQLVGHTMRDQRRKIIWSCISESEAKRQHIMENLEKIGSNIRLLRLDIDSLASQALKVYPKLQPFAKKPTFKSTEQFGYGENEDYQAGHKGGGLLLLQIMPISQVGQDFNRRVRIPSRSMSELNAEREHKGGQTGHDWSSAICVYPDICESELVDQVLEHELEDAKALNPSSQTADISADYSEIEVRDFIYALDISFMDQDSSSHFGSEIAMGNEVDTATRSPLSDTLPAEESSEAESFEEDLLHL
ncbi:protein MpR2R3-MYB3 [Marchantia polymorpha subsp. ruderalis]|uniref:Uncharacterized protein n=2 Tax=Marchantia polymorpha TaxID=3197 RepID=A0AAF6AWT5_MARPO|nr:hypothetical protein MARPO_0007s0265 [Marchantia polymorpha]BBN04219.1 hypothetical protein Mp_3g02770 [Marchantia polymorpha subsp. ruderalis]|eukprot:PTQ47909.1 hypothetical protein MARPO_0007s0265 [Marchantia polymorpha]